MCILEHLFLHPYKQTYSPFQNMQVAKCHVLSAIFLRDVQYYELRVCQNHLPLLGMLNVYTLIQPFILLSNSFRTSGSETHNPPLLWRPFQ